jgi:hypothetical protein
MPDVTAVFQIVSFACALLALHVMQQAWLDPASKGDARWLQLVRRLAYGLLIIGLAWNIRDHDQRGTAPTLAEFLIVLGIALMFLVRSVILYQHRNDRITFKQSPAERIIHQ